MDICHLKNAELEAKHQRYKGRVVLRGDIVKDDSGAYAVFTEQGSSASQMTAAKIMDVIATLPDYEGQAADAVSAYTQVNMEDAPRLLKIPKSVCPDVWIRLPRHTWPKSWTNIEDPVVPLERNLHGHPSAGLLWERQCEEVLLKTWMGKSTGLGMFICSQETRIILVDMRWRHQHSWEKSRIWHQCGRNWWRTLILTKLRRFFITSTWDVFNVNANQMRPWLKNTQRWLNHVFLQEQEKNYLDGKNLTHKR